MGITVTPLILISDHNLILMIQNLIIMVHHYYHHIVYRLSTEMISLTQHHHQGFCLITFTSISSNHEYFANSMSPSASLTEPALCRTCWSPGLPLSHRPLLLRPLSWELHILVCLAWLNHWGWTLAVNTLPCCRLWQRGWVRWRWTLWRSLLKTLFKGVVTSPNFPGNYPNLLDRTETIQVAQGQILSLQFTAFAIDGSHPNCIFDHLTITDGDGTTLMEKSCGSSSDGSIVIGGQSIGSSLPAAIVSTSNVVNLVFITDDIDTFSGWSVSWIAVTPGECQQHVWIFLTKLLNFFWTKQLRVLSRRHMFSTHPNHALSLFPSYDAKRI